MIDWQDPYLQPLPLNSGGSLRVSGWQSPTQAILWPQLRANTWHNLLVKGHKPETYAGQGLVIRGTMPHKSYTITWLSMEDGHKHSEERGVGGIDGKMVIYCPKDQQQLVAIIKMQE